jgi:hypothetical protein
LTVCHISAKLGYFAGGNFDCQWAQSSQRGLEKQWGKPESVKSEELIPAD